MSAMAIDTDSQRAQSVHIATYDLNEPDQVTALSDFIIKHFHIILWAHFAPSCGTVLRARGRPLPKLAKMGIKVPQPLRSDSKTMGMDGLSGLGKIKAECANITYESTCELMCFCINLDIAVSLENRKNSLFWKVPMVEAFLLEVGGYNTVFDNCSHGGIRKKATAWWSNVDWFTAKFQTDLVTTTSRTQTQWGRPPPRRVCKKQNTTPKHGSHCTSRSTLFPHRKTSKVSWLFMQHALCYVGLLALAPS